MEIYIQLLHLFTTEDDGPTSLNIGEIMLLVAIAVALVSTPAGLHFLFDPQKKAHLGVSTPPALFGEIH